ncbi:hypothetical protein VTK26DRAFT_3512 [Humicola hyalothermophila]
MRAVSLALAALLGAATLASAAERRPCGFKIAPCPSGETCKQVDPACDRGENCAGECVPASPPTLTAVVPTKPTTTSPPDQRPTYASCGGLRPEPADCPEGYICIDDPYAHGCGLACDQLGICVEPVFCGGFAGIPCKDGKICIDDPRDKCDPVNGGADCGGICV